MVRPYLNKSDHDEFLAQYKLERNQRIRKNLLIFTLVASVLGTGAYFIFSSSSSSVSNNLPAYIGGEESQDIRKSTEPETKLIAANQAPEDLDEGYQQALAVSEMEKAMTEEDIQALQEEKESPTPNQVLVPETTPSLGTTRGGDPVSVNTKNTNTSTVESPIIRVSDEKPEIKTPVEPETGMKRNPELDARDETPLFSAEKMPKFPGGYSALRRFIKTRLQIPKEAQKNKVDGTVQVQFIVNTGGTISNARISKGLGYGCDEAAIALVRDMPKWIPGKQNGQTVAVYYNLPIKFSTK